MTTRIRGTLWPCLLLGLLVVTLLVGVTATFMGCFNEARKPNFVCILIDTLRSDHLGCYGYPRATSPNIDRLAEEGVLFEDATAQSSWTLPSMISYMSGRYLFSEIPKLPEDTENLPSLFKGLGYQTAGFVANSLVGDKEGFSRGFDHFEIRQHKTPQWSAEDLNKRMLPWMEQELKPPFFLYVHYLDPHFPYTPPPAYADFDDDHNPIPANDMIRFKEMLRKYPKLKPDATQDVKEMRRQINRYDGEVRFVDHHLGRLMDRLKELGLDENTVVILTSDHGECLWDHPHYPGEVEKTIRKNPELDNLTTYFFRDHGYHLFREFIGVPFIIKGPGILQNRRVKESVENVDLLPTLLGLTGSDRAFQGDGRDLNQVLTDPTFNLPQKPLIFSHCNEGTCAIQPETKMKMITPTPVGEKFGLKNTFLDLQTDPKERINRLQDLGEITEDIPRALLDAIKEKEKGGYFRGKQGDVDNETQDKMKELGYTR